MQLTSGPMLSGESQVPAGSSGVDMGQVPRVPTMQSQMGAPGMMGFQDMRNSRGPTPSEPSWDSRDIGMVGGGGMESFGHDLNGPVFGSVPEPTQNVGIARLPDVEVEGGSRPQTPASEHIVPKSNSLMSRLGLGDSPAVTYAIMGVVIALFAAAAYLLCQTGKMGKLISKYFKKNDSKEGQDSDIESQREATKETKKKKKGTVKFNLPDEDEDSGAGVFQPKVSGGKHKKNKKRGKKDTANKSTRGGGDAKQDDASPARDADDDAEKNLSADPLWTPL